MGSTNRVVEIERETLKKVLGIGDLFAVGYGDLGSSIYYALGITALFALGATPIALALAGIVFVCTALTYAEMTSMFHESGGSASFARHAFNDLISFIAGWGLLLDYIVTIAISAFAVGPYLAYFYPDLKIRGVHTGFSMGLIVILLLINILGIRQSTRISLVLTSVTILTQVVIIAIGLLLLPDISQVFTHLRIGVQNVDWSPSWHDFWKGVAMAMVAYTGIESIAQLGAETKKSSKNLPRAVLLTMTVLVLMYLGIAVVALSAMSAKELGTTYVFDPIAGIVDHLPIGGKILGPWLGIIAAALLFVASNAGLVGASRLSYNMGEYYQLPRFFSKIHPRFRTPYAALGFFAVLAVLVILWSRGHLSFLADLYNFGAMIAFFSAHLSLIVMRIKQPDMKRPFRIGLNIRVQGCPIPLTAIVGALATMGVWILVVITKPEGRYLGMTWMALGIAMYLAFRRKQKLKATGQLAIEKIKMPEFRPLNVKNILVPTRGGTETETIQMACELAKFHNAKLTAVTVIEVPYSLPLDTYLPHRIAMAEAILKRAEAIAREISVKIELQVLHSRSIQETILHMLHHGKYDLLVLGAMRSYQEAAAHKGLGSIAEKIIKEAPCRVFVVRNSPHNREEEKIKVPDLKLSVADFDR